MVEAGLFPALYDQYNMASKPFTLLGWAYLVQHKIVIFWGKIAMQNIHIGQDHVHSNMKINFQHSKCWTIQKSSYVFNFLLV